MSVRRSIHWDDDGVVLYGGVAAEQGVPVLDCLQGLRAMMFRWSELDLVRLVEPYPSVELTYAFEGARQRERVVPPAADSLDAFSEHVQGFCQEVQRRRGPGRVVAGWQTLAAVPWEPVCAMPNDPGSPNGGIYRGLLHGRPVVAARKAAGARERWGLVGIHGKHARVLARQRLPWSVRGREVLLTYDHVYARTRRGVLRIGIELLRRRIDLPQMRLYLFGRRSVLILADRKRCPLQSSLDRLLTPRLLQIG